MRQRTNQPMYRSTNQSCSFSLGQEVYRVTISNSSPGYCIILIRVLSRQAPTYAGVINISQCVIFLLQTKPEYHSIPPHPRHTTSQLVLGYTTLYFVAILVILAYAEPATLPTPTVSIWGQAWPVYGFAVASILIVVSSGLFVAYLR